MRVRALVARGAFAAAGTALRRAVTRRAVSATARCKLGGVGGK